MRKEDDNINKTNEFLFLLQIDENEKKYSFNEVLGGL